MHGMDEYEIIDGYHVFLLRWCWERVVGGLDQGGVCVMSVCVVILDYLC